MPFKEMMTDDVFFEDSGGNRSGPYKTKFGTDTLRIFNDQARIEEGDIAIQTLPNNSEVRFVVQDVQFSSGVEAIPACYTVHIVKESKQNKEKAVSGNTTYNINAANVQVGDGNTQNIVDAFQELAAKIEHSGATPQEKEEAKGLIKGLLSNATIAAILGGAVSGLLG
ncbi:hypothetical protein IOQ59_07485 [Pontibacterium sp. N1Y112]|uniref:Uncharacterized protein n=1 Tax=Pontibacterium sinense TaxID=2781979 RepID=A0A8J7FBM0_9GAMM|nr:hypothetical protein [Pontibacterium sinense]MBE9397102.1 hypothetical protein [Pontibacterium sinense]